MFNKFMNNFYFGKSGKADFTEDDLPTNRWQLFMDTLKVRMSALVRLNLMYVIVWIPTLFLLGMGAMNVIQISYQMDMGDGKSVYSMQAEVQAEDEATANSEEAQYYANLEVLSAEQARDRMLSVLFSTLLFLIPCVAITGPCTAGVSYVCRNWSRDEHAFIWSDFKDAVKENWKQSLPVSLITGILPFVVYMCWTFYGGMAANSAVMVIPQVLVLMIGLVWAISVTYMHPMIVSYKLKFRDVLRNSILLAIARLPMSVGIRLLHMVPLLITLAIAFFWNYSYGLLFALVYYLLIGFSLSRFVTASFTNGVFDRFINSHIEGAKVNRGLRVVDDDDDEEDDEDAAEES